MEELTAAQADYCYFSLVELRRLEALIETGWYKHLNYVQFVHPLDYGF
jgi:hypothetical protein